MKKLYITIAGLFIFTSSQLCSQGKSIDSVVNDKLQSNRQKPAPQPYSLFRAEENYDYLKNKDKNLYKTDYADPLKLIGLNKSKSINLGFGGEIRPRIEHFANRNWQANDISYYSQRISLHTNIKITEYLRVFGEIYHGLLSDAKRYLNLIKLIFIRHL